MENGLSTPKEFGLAPSTAQHQHQLEEQQRSNRLQGHLWGPHFFHFCFNSSNNGIMISSFLNLIVHPTTPLPVVWNNPHAILGESCIALTPRDRLCDAGVKDFLRPNTLIYLTVIASIVTALVRSCWSTGTENSSNTYIYTDIYTPVDMLNETTTTTREYSLPGVLHYLQSEWRRFERERNEWAIERAELKVHCRIKKGQRTRFPIVKH